MTEEQTAVVEQHREAEQLEDLTLVALTPSDMVPAQQALREWCERKVQGLKAELAEHEQNMHAAIDAGLKTSAFEATIRRTERRVVYYDKIRAAVESGYLIVPNFPIDVFAVRVKRAKQRSQTSNWRGRFEANAEQLPAGEGRYVDDQLMYTTEQYQSGEKDGKPVMKRRFISDDFDTVDFPVTLVKPEVLRATQRAMTLRLFDQLGVVQNQTGRDPIVVGRLLDPRGNGRCTTFFIAWWLDTATL